MRLPEWIEQSGMRRVEIARHLGISPGSLTDLCNNRFWPTRSLAQRIWRLTQGEVGPNDYLFVSKEEADIAASWADRRPPSENHRSDRGPGQG
jgi:3,4-dihydroxy 2-butanone 4-phosphate synthase/GTP cyclohydrolase II